MEKWKYIYKVGTEKEDAMLKIYIVSVCVLVCVKRGVGKARLGAEV